MIRADDIIESLLARTPGKLMLERHTRLPYAWALWLRRLPPLVIKWSGIELAAQMSARVWVPATAEMTAAASPWQALRQLLWQQWDPAPRDERALRWLSAFASGVIHVCFALLLLWFALVRAVQPRPEDAPADASRMRLEFIGKGTPAESGGGAPSNPSVAAAAVRPPGAGNVDVPPSPPAAAHSSRTPARRASTRKQSPTVATPAPAAAPQPMAQPAPVEAASAAALPPKPIVAKAKPTPPADGQRAPSPAQPVQASEAVVPPHGFVVPPPRIAETVMRPALPKVDAPPVRQREVTTVETPALNSPPALQPMDMPTSAMPQVTVHEREVETVTAPEIVVQVPAMQQPPRSKPQTEIAVREREVVTVQAPPSPVIPAEPRIVDPGVPAPQISINERSVESVQVPEVTVARVPAALRSPEISAPDLQVQQRAVVAAPDPAPVARESVSRVPAATGHMPAEVSAIEVPSVSADLESPAATGDSTAENRSEVATASTQTDAATGSSQSTAAMPASTAGRSGTAPGAGPAPNDRAGGWDSIQRADDWGAAKTNAPGTGLANSTNDGLFDSDGSVRVDAGAAKPATPPRGAPGSEVDSWSRERIAQAGKWLKPPPYNYTPTSFDRYWVPNESLLEEWVRKGIKKIEIAIPGTSTRISCVVSLLQFGGGCGLTDPDKNEQPAQARPPPDVPFKPQLQQAESSVR